MVSTIRAELPRLTIRRGPSALAVGRVAARVAIVAAVLIAGFVVYEFGVTSLVAQRAQGGLRDDLIAWETTNPVSHVTYVPAGHRPAPVTVPAGVPTPEPAEPSVSGTIAVSGAPLPRMAVGRIVIETAGVDWVFVEGVDRGALRSGVGHMPETALPGEPGNAVLSGHRTTYGAPFLHLDRVEPGDLITVTSASGDHTYQVVEVRTVASTDTSVTGQWSGAWLTLTTCTPAFSARDRLVVVSRLVAGPNAGVILAGS